MPQEVHGTMAEHGQSLCPFVCANPAGIFMKGHLENPMERMRHAPVLPYGLGEPPPLRRQRGEKLPRCDLPFLPDCTTRLHPPNTLPLGPGGLGSQ